MVDEAGGGEGGRASSPSIAFSDVRMFEGDLKKKEMYAMTSETSDVKPVVGVSGAGPFKRDVRTKKQLTAEQVAAIATARRREMSPLLQDDAVQVEVAYALLFRLLSLVRKDKPAPASKKTKL